MRHLNMFVMLAMALVAIAMLAVPASAQLAGSSIDLRAGNARLHMSHDNFGSRVSGSISTRNMDYRFYREDRYEYVPRRTPRDDYRDRDNFYLSRPYDGMRGPEHNYGGCYEHRRVDPTQYGLEDNAGGRLIAGVFDVNAQANRLRSAPTGWVERPIEYRSAPTPLDLGGMMSMSVTAPPGVTEGISVLVPMGSRFVRLEQLEEGSQWWYVHYTLPDGSPARKLVSIRPLL